MALFNSTFQDFTIGNIALRFPNEAQSSITKVSAAKFTNSTSEARKVEAMIAALAKHDLTFSLLGVTRTEEIYWGAAEYPKNYLSRQMNNGSWTTMVVKYHFMLVIGDLDNAQFVYDGHSVYTTAGKRNATRFINMSDAEQATFLSDVKVQIPLL
jgi:hypothetical protein